MIALSKFVRLSLAVVFSVAVFGLSACGRSSGSLVVASVGPYSVTRSGLAKWTATEAILSYQGDYGSTVPPGLVPDPPSFSKCAQFMRTHALAGEQPPKGSPAKLKALCAAKQTALQRHVLDILLIAYWLKSEAAELHVKLSRSEVTATSMKVAPTPGALRAYLAVSRERMVDLELIAEKDLLDSKLLELKEAALARNHPDFSTSQLVVQAAREFTRKWSARTYCRTGYVISDCQQFRGKRSLIAP